MFMTLDLDKGNPRAGGNENGNGPPSGEGRFKRNQVRRACDWCKLMRIKCDNDRPCYNCQQSDRNCGMSGKNQFRSIAAAVKEVEALRAQILELESSRGKESNSWSFPPIEASGRSPPPSPYSERQWASRNGVRVGSILYGVVSLPFLVTRLGQFLAATRPHLKLDISTCIGATDIPPSLAPICFNTKLANYLPAHQEVHFLALFWQTHYFSFPILNESMFRREYQALVAESGPRALRKASPLVDIVLALSMQLASFRILQPSDSMPDTAASPKSSYPSLAGFQYYQRCQEVIDQTIESPSITTVQCYIFSIVYLYEADLVNRAQVVAGKAVMLAMLLGLSSEPPQSGSEPEKEVARRTWWSLYALDVMLSMEVGRPPMIGLSESNCRPPSDSTEIAQWLSPHYRHDDACPSWLGFQTQTLRLLQVARIARSAFCSKYDEIVGDNGHESFVGNGEAREECARFFTEPMKKLDAWARDVPKGYYVPRKEGSPFSTERSILDLEPNPNILVHCQRQRLLLELQYHHQCMILYQSFIPFASTLDMPTPLSDGKAAAGLSHAVALTTMIHQALTTSEALSGVYHVFRWQKTALLIMLSYTYTFPLSHSRAAIRKAVEMGIAVADMYADTLPEAAAAATIVRSLANDMGAVINNFYTTGDDWPSSSWLTSSGTTTPPRLSTASSGVSLASPANVAAPSNIQPSITKIPPKQDLTMQTTTTTTTTTTMEALPPTPAVASDELLDLGQFNVGSLRAIGDIGSNWETMDMLWASLDPFESPHADPWTTLLGDFDLEGLGKNDMHLL